MNSHYGISKELKSVIDFSLFKAYAHLNIDSIVTIITIVLHCYTLYVLNVHCQLPVPVPAACASILNVN